MSMMLLAAQDADLAAAVAKAREMTRADRPCRTDADSDEIVVCARREADNYRVPFVLSANPRNSVPMQTAELLEERGRLPCGQGAIIAQCGSMVGVSVSVGADGIHYVRRELAP
ncbi:hypothetical protein P1X14_20790 [Sphingomonas sp. AOB5]|uniref:hypothetical protein n=1 Tax=Sphingomonas sp. AOB5 TaxID=3034017 RepID=UPI0023F8E81B|nr:hypothetical protein [Sphingomonas sp. AOB5]MDF7777705.1 hypothetical protein [Sphingomonas sp. AOB5]